MTPPGTVHRILGCPGGGLSRKTRKLTELAARAAGQYGGHNVLAVSLTRTAAAELRGRADAIPQENCATLHAHALRALEVDPTALAETSTAMREFTADNDGCWAGGNVHHRDNIDDVANFGVPSLHVAVTNHRARLTPRSEWTDDERDYHAAWEDWKTQTRRVDFTDLIETCIREQVAPLQAPQVILADEAQDFTALEFQLLMAWAQGARSTVCVGDSQQCIYWFRGADPERLDALPVARGETLARSWRCPQAVADAAKRWAAQLPGDNVAWTSRYAAGHVEEAPVALRDTPDVIDLAQASVATGQTTMILASCRYMLAPLCHELRERGIAHANPWREEEAQWNPLKGTGARAVRGLLAPLSGRFWTWGDLWAMTEPMRAAALARGAKASIEEHCRPDEFGVSRAGQEVAFSTLLTLLGVEGDEPHALLGIDQRRNAIAFPWALQWYEDHLLARGYKSVRYALDVVRNGGSLDEAPLLTVGTIHSVKGGEADHVILAPELSKEGYYGSWLGGGKARDAIVRAYYVGLTRARETVTLLEPGCPEHAPVSDVLREASRA